MHTLSTLLRNTAGCRGLTPWLTAPYVKTRIGYTQPRVSLQQHYLIVPGFPYNGLKHALELLHPLRPASKKRESHAHGSSPFLGQTLGEAPPLHHHIVPGKERAFCDCEFRAVIAWNDRRSTFLGPRLRQGGHFRRHVLQGLGVTPLARE